MSSRIWLLFGGAVLFGLTGCGPVERATNPGAYPKDKVEEVFRDKLKFRSVALHDSADGTLTGNGQDAEGKNCEIAVRRRPADSRFEYTIKREDGSVGSGELGGEVRWVPLVLAEEAEREIKSW